MQRCIYELITNAIKQVRYLILIVIIAFVIISIIASRWNENNMKHSFTIIFWTERILLVISGVVFYVYGILRFFKKYNLSIFAGMVGYFVTFWYSFGTVQDIITPFETLADIIVLFITSGIGLFFFSIFGYVMGYIIEQTAKFIKAMLQTK